MNIFSQDRDEGADHLQKFSDEADLRSQPEKPIACPARPTVTIFGNISRTGTEA